jgi:hypothetical protein
MALVRQEWKTFNTSFIYVPVLCLLYTSHLNEKIICQNIKCLSLEVFEAIQ